jgi:alkylresorcinol/alkylpyrone synthase
MPKIISATSAFPKHYHSQQEMSSALRKEWLKKGLDVAIFDRLQKAVTVEGRYLALPMSEYYKLDGFADSNRAWLKVALELGERVILDLLKKSSLPADGIDLLMSTTVTGITVPSLEARLMNRIPFAADLKRIPMFGLGCLAGTAGIARVADYLKGHPDEAAILLSVELCSLTLQAEDISIANIISSGLFGDGAAAVLLVGDKHPLACMDDEQRGNKTDLQQTKILDGFSKSESVFYHPYVLSSRSIFFPDSEEVMGWDVTDRGLKIVLGQGVPDYAEQLRPHVDSFLSASGLSVADIDFWLIHPGGPKVIDVIESALGLPEKTLDRTRKHLREIGNLSSTSVLVLLDEYLNCHLPELSASSGEEKYGMMLSMGPAFSAELLLLKC